jgi:hypothetical protein
MDECLEQAALESLGHRRKWKSERGIRYLNDHIEKVINDKRESSKHILPTDETES